jgi:hypothetical protein
MTNIENTRALRPDIIGGAKSGNSSAISVEHGGGPREESPSRARLSRYYSNPDAECAAEAVGAWAMKVPIGMGLCPWAGKSRNRGLLRIVSCDCELPGDAADVLESEIVSLIQEGTPPLSTTLVVCPRVKAWNEFRSFDEFVRSGIRSHPREVAIMERVTLVAFHPDFIRWRGLPDGVTAGSTVQTHYGTFGRKSARTAEATIVETNGSAFGLRKVKVRFRDALDGLVRQEQYVPTDWIDFPIELCAPLPDNAMHRAPYPTIHIIVNQDLASLCVRDVSRVKRLNAQRNAKLGWEGLGCPMTVDDAPNEARID